MVTDIQVGKGTSTEMQKVPLQNSALHTHTNCENSISSLHCEARRHYLTSPLPIFKFRVGRNDG
jgi:hypothetical protein